MKRAAAEHERGVTSPRARGRGASVERLRDLRLRRGLEHLLATIRQDPEPAAGWSPDLGTAA